MRQHCLRLSLRFSRKGSHGDIYWEQKAFSIHMLAGDLHSHSGPEPQTIQHSSNWLCLPVHFLPLGALQGRCWLVEGGTWVFSGAIFRKGQLLHNSLGNYLHLSLGNSSDPLRPAANAQGQGPPSIPTNRQTPTRDAVATPAHARACLSQQARKSFATAK